MSVYSIIKKPFFGRYQRPWTWPEEVSRERWSRVEFPNKSGARLVGLFAKTEAPPARGVVVLPHPMAADAKAWGLKSGHADMLLAGGYHVLTFDFNGFGESEDGRFEFPGDIHAAGLQARALAPGLPVVLYGISMGAGYGVCAMDAEDNPFRVAVIENAFTSLDEFWRKYALPYAVLRTLSVLMPGLARELRPIDRIGRVKKLESMLLIYGTQDRATPPEMGERLLAASALPEERRALWLVPEARHLAAMTVAPEAYRARVMSFLDGACGQSIPSSSAN